MEEINGIFWIPDNGPKVKGLLMLGETVRLNIKEDFSTTLKAGFSDPKSRLHLVVGESTDGEPITLAEGRFDSIGSNQFQMAFLGLHFSNIANFIIDQTSVEYTYLERWLNLNSMSANRKRMLEGKMPYTYEGFQLLIPDFSATAHVQLKYSLDGDQITTDTFHQSAVVDFSFSKACDIGKLISLLVRFQLYLSLVSGIPIEFGKISVNPSGYSVRDKVVFHFGSRKRKAHLLPQNAVSPFLSFDDLQGSLKETFSCWGEFMNNHESVYSLFLALMYFTPEFAENYFLVLIQAIEILHRRTHNETYLDRGTYANFEQHLFEKVPLETYPQEFRGHFKDLIKNGNQYSLRKRLKDYLKNELFDYQTSLFLDQTKPIDFVHKVVHTRNHFTHEGPAGGSGVAKGDELVQL